MLFTIQMNVFKYSMFKSMFMEQDEIKKYLLQSQSDLLIIPNDQVT